MATSCKACGTTDQVVPAGFCTKCLQDMLAGHAGAGSDVKPASSNKVAAVDRNAWLLKGSLLDNNNNTTKKEIRKVFVDAGLERHLKPYQRQGVEFLWKNSFSDCNFFDKGNPSEIGGCILAHYMGLGKSLTTITLLHTALTCPTLVPTAAKKPLFHSVLLLAPANTLTNWEDEVEKWTGKLDEPLKIWNLGKAQPGYQTSEIKKWKRDGGVLLMSDNMFLKLADEIMGQVQPDVLVLDEAHTMLKRSANKGYKKLQEIQTKRRILLTGTPLQNNVTEYFRMVEFIRPGVIGVDSEADFEDEFRKPIECGLPTDASNDEKLTSLRKQVELKRKIEQFVDRKSASVLREQLPPIYDTLLSLHPSRIQTRLIKLDKWQRHEKLKDKNFFRMYHAISPVLNHPGCLKVAKRRKGKELSWKTLDEVDEEKDQWFIRDEINEKGLKKTEFDKMHQARTSPKLIILAHILAIAVRDEHKVLIYSENLKTLDIVEWFLSRDDWKKHVHSLGQSFSRQKLGGWKKDEDFIRMDGSTNSGKRGSLVDRFNSDERIKAFVISSLAGGIGINLCSASVVVIMDNHFNPSVSDQCISRAHRLGQDKPVHCFRLAIEGTMESKIYARSVNKAGVAMQVIDGKFSEKRFTADELNDLKESITTATCDRCDRRRILPPEQDPPGEDDKWFCSMNQDVEHNSCHKPEQAGLLKRHDRMNQRAAEDPILQHVLGVVNSVTMKKEIVAAHHPVEIIHETDICCEDAIQKLEGDIADQKEARAQKLASYAAKIKARESAATRPHQHNAHNAEPEGANKDSTHVFAPPHQAPTHSSLDDSFNATKKKPKVPVASDLEVVDLT